MKRKPPSLLGGDPSKEQRSGRAALRSIVRARRLIDGMLISLIERAREQGMATIGATVEDAGGRRIGGSGRRGQELLAKGVGPKEIASRLGMARSSVYRVIEHAGLKQPQ